MRSLLVILCFSIVGRVVFAQNIEGPWNSTLEYSGTTLEFQIDISKVDTGYLVSMSVPKQSPQAFDASTVIYEDSSLFFEIAVMGVKYDGKVINEKLIEGTYYQSGREIEMNLTPGAVTLNRPQDPKKPYPYREEEIAFKNAKAEITLRGTMTLPKDDSNRYPAVILISGSGPEDRNEQIFGHKPFLVIADHLTRNGIAVLRYDERGVGESEGVYDGSTTYDLKEDVMAGIEYLRSRDDIDLDAIGIIGHSEGGVIGPMIAAEDPTIQFVVMLAGPAMKMNELMLLQKELIERKMGIDEPMIATGQKTMSEAYDIIIATEPGDTTLDSKLRAHFDQAYNGAVKEEQIDQIVQQIGNPWMATFLRIDPMDYLPNVKCPVLALNGDKDLQVPAENLAYLKDILRQNGNKKVKIITMNDVNHLFQTCETGLPGEYAQIDETFSPLALNIMSEWILKQVK